MAFISGTVPEAFLREVTATPAEFERDLRKAWPAGVECPAIACFRLEDGTLRLEIDIAPAGIRRLGLFELPILHAHYRFSGGDAAARHRMLSRLDRAMQRGGG